VNVGRRVPGATTLAAGALLLVACGGAHKPTELPPAATTTTTAPVSNGYALAYTDGAAGRADPSKSPVVIGYVNEEGATPAFPEATQGIDAAVAYVNAELGGIQGHPLQLDKCAVQVEADGQRCGADLLNNAKVQLIITGALVVGNRSLYGVIAGKKPILVSNPLANEDYVSDGVTAFTPGVPGVVQGLAVFVAKHLQAVKSVAVVYGDDAAAKLAAEQLFEPLITKLGVIDVTPVQVSDTANAAGVQSAIQRAGAGKADVLVPLVDIQLCVATYDAVQALGLKATVVTSALCEGTPMTSHLQDVGSKDVVPDGWYFGGYGYNYFIPDDASGMTTYLAKVHQYGPAGIEYTGFAGPVFANLLTAAKFYNQIGPDTVNTANLSQAIKSFKGPMMLVAGSMNCGSQPLFKSLCGTTIGVEQYKAGTWSPIADALNNQAIDASRP